MKKVVLYYRVSTPDQKNALHSQKIELFKYAHANSYQVCGSFSDIGSSQNLFEREGIVNLLNFCMTADVDIVLITERDRLTRIVMHMGFMKVQLQKQGVEILAINDPVDVEDPTQRLITGIIDLFGEWEYHSRKLRVERGWNEAKKQGKAVFRAPIGYKNKDGVLIPDPKYVFIIQEMFKIAKDTTDIKKVQSRVKQLIQVELDLRRIKYILTNPVYCGVLHLDGQVFDNNHEPLISKELFSKVSSNFQ